MSQQLQYLQCLKHQQTFKGFYLQNNEVVNFCGDCLFGLNNIQSHKFLYSEIIEYMVRQYEQKRIQNKQFSQTLNEFNQKLKCIIEKIENSISSDLQELKQKHIQLIEIKDKIKQNTPLTSTQFTYLQKFTDHQNPDFKLYSLINDQSENMHNTIGKMEDKFLTQFQDIQNEIPSFDITLIKLCPNEKNLTPYLMKLNQFINKEIYKLKTKTKNIYIENCVKESGSAQDDQFYYQNYTEKYLVKDIAKLFDDIKDYLQESSKTIFVQNQFEKQSIEYKNYEIHYENILQQVSDNEVQFQQDPRLILFNEDEVKPKVDNFYYVQEELENQ